MVAQSLNNLALLYDAWGRYSESEPLYKRSLEIGEKALGKDHPGVAVSLNNLALLYWRQGRYSESEPLFRRSLEIKEKTLGKDHPDVAVTLGNLALLYQGQGKYSEAEQMIEASLDIFKRKGLPIRWPQNLIASLYLDLAVLYPDRGYIARAEPIVAQAGFPHTRGRLSLMKKDFKKARDYFGQVQTEAEENLDVNYLFRCAHRPRHGVRGSGRRCRCHGKLSQGH